MAERDENQIPELDEQDTANDEGMDDEEWEDDEEEETSEEV